MTDWIVGLAQTSLPRWVTDWIQDPEPRGSALIEWTTRAQVAESNRQTGQADPGNCQTPDIGWGNPQIGQRMSIRKTGAVTGEVTGVEPQEGITATAAPAGWTPRDEDALTEESTDGDAPE